MQSYVCMTLTLILVYYNSEEYFSLIDEFMRAVTKRWPHVLVQFEDFSNENALPILEKYRYKYLCFNDDIQGTGAVALSGVLSALRIRGSDVKSLAKERIVIVGAGSAGVGVANSLAWTMVTELGIRPEVPPITLKFPSNLILIALT